VTRTLSSQGTRELLKFDDCGEWLHLGALAIRRFLTVDIRLSSGASTRGYTPGVYLQQPDLGRIGCNGAFTCRQAYPVEVLISILGAAVSTVLELVLPQYRGHRFHVGVKQWRRAGHHLPLDGFGFAGVGGGGPAID